MKSGHTGAHYSLFRLVFGFYLLIHFLAAAGAAPKIAYFTTRILVPLGGDGPLFGASQAVVFGVSLVAALLSVSFALGKFDRLVAVLLSILWVTLIGGPEQLGLGSFPIVTSLLVLHLFVPPAPFGSVAALGRLDPGGGWRMPRTCLLVGWLLFGGYFVVAGYAHLSDVAWVDGSAIPDIVAERRSRGAVNNFAIPIPKLTTWIVLAIELLALPLALHPRTRCFSLLLCVAYVWLLVGTVGLDDDLPKDLWLLPLFLFDPSCLPGKRFVLKSWRSPPKAPYPSLPQASEDSPLILFYDGSCGLCHRTVRLVLAEDPTGDTFRFAPLDSATFQAAFHDQGPLPDSLVLLAPDGDYFVKSDASIRTLHHLGGLWTLLAVCLHVIPRPIRDAGYDAIARIRYRLFERPKDACPMMPPEYGRRWLP